MKVAIVERREGHIPWGALAMAPLFFLPLGAWVVETGAIDLGVCSLKQFTGTPCLSCGSTRGTIALLHGEFATAFAFQPMMMTIYAILLVWGTISLLTFWRDERVMIRLGRAETWAVRFAIVAIPVANWVYLIHADI